MYRFQNLKQRETRKVCHQSFWCDSDRAHGLNISEGGMCLRFARRAEVGETVVLSHGPTLQVKGRIAWTRRLQNCTEVGVQFQDSEAQAKAWFEFASDNPDSNPKNGKDEAKMLALPAPEHTSRNAQFPLGLSNGVSQRPIFTTNAKPTSFRSGGTWQTAVRMMGTNNPDQ